jgi:hypothetical protein
MLGIKRCLLENGPQASTFNNVNDSGDDAFAAPSWIDELNWHGCRETSPQSTRRAFNRSVRLPRFHPSAAATNDTYAWKSEWRDHIKDGEGSSARSYVGSLVI